MSLTANLWLVSTCSAAQTVPIPPSPSTRSRRYRPPTTRPACGSAFPDSAPRSDIGNVPCGEVWSLGESTVPPMKRAFREPAKDHLSQLHARALAALLRPDAM